MANIVFAAPGIDRFHLHERLHRVLRHRGHQVSALCLDAATYVFLHNQDLPAHLVRVGHAIDALAPLDEFQRRDVALGVRSQTSSRRGMQRLLPALRAWFDDRSPDLVVLHQRRDANAALLHFVARERGCRVLWTGDGLLPHTMQIDERGLDGEASASHRRVMDYRVVRGDVRLLDACLSGAFANSSPVALPARAIVVPPIRQRIASLWTGDKPGPAAFREAMWGWRRALAPGAAAATPPSMLPDAPFIAILLQRPDDPKIRLDATRVTESELVEATARAMANIDARCRLVVVDVRARTGSAKRRAAKNGMPVHRVGSAAAIEAAATAAAVVTVNHALASVALLAGTPVVHLGGALYGLPGVTTRTTLTGLDQAMLQALTHDHPTLRQRFLTWLFGYGHVWCSTTQPDHNGMQGLVQAIEAHLQPAPAGPALRYRPGPAWPLASERRV